MNIIKNPWNERFFNFVNNCSKSLKIMSPFVKKNIVNELYRNLNRKVEFTIITSFKLMNFYRRASDIEAIRLILQNNGTVKNYQNLHSKIYIFDDSRCVISSSNLTEGGLVRNYEYGLYLEDKFLLNEVVNDFEDISRSELTGKISDNEINTATKII